MKGTLNFALAVNDLRETPLGRVWSVRVRRHAKQKFRHLNGKCSLA